MEIETQQDRAISLRLHSQPVRDAGFCKAKKKSRENNPLRHKVRRIISNL